MPTNPHANCGASWRHLRDTLIDILGERIPPNPRGISDTDIHNAVRENLRSNKKRRRVNSPAPLSS